MKKKICRIFSYGCVALFFIYWMAVLLLSMPSNRVKQYLGNQFPRFRYTFTSTWNLFSPPYLNQTRLYYIVKDDLNDGRTDTFEVMKKLLLHKQKAAPFNQKENILDHALHHAVSGLVSATWRGKEKPAGTGSRIDSQTVARAMAAAEQDPQYQRCFGSLQNYFRVVWKENNIDTTGKLVKIVLIEKRTRPFKEIKNLQYVPKETLVFESGYLPIRP